MFANNRVADCSTLMRELETAFRETRVPDFSSGNLEGWTSALHNIMVQGDLDCAMYAAKHISTVFPSIEYVRNVRELFDHLPPADDRLLPFRDNAENDVQVVRRPNADAVILLFCAFPHLLGTPLSAIHRWLGRLPASLIYLNDPKNLAYLQGIQSLGPDRETTLAGLQEIIGSLGARRILCYGDSAGGFSALHYGVDLGAEAVLGTGAITNVALEFNAKLRQVRRIMPLHRHFPGLSVDLRERFAAVRQPPRTLLVYAENNWDDRLHAWHLSNLSCVTLRKVPNYAKHNVTLELIQRNEYQSVLDWLVGS
jgi:hypothetical protein